MLAHPAIPHKFKMFYVFASYFCCYTTLILKNFRLQIEGDQLFMDISGVLSAAMHWEERAAHILASEAQMSDFEDAIRFDVVLIFSFWMSWVMQIILQWIQ